MLHRYCSQFFAYCELDDSSARCIQTLSIRLNELATFLKIKRIQSVKKVRYGHLIDFTADYNAPSIHVTKSRAWTPRQFCHFLTLHRVIPENIATGIPYPKIEKTVTQFLTPDQYNRLIFYFSEQPDLSVGLRNLIEIMLNMTTNKGFDRTITL